MLTGARILLVEDDTVSLIPIRQMLTSLGGRIDVARDGRAAVEHASRQRYDLILMDCQMPVMDGFEATRRIRRQELGEAEPAVAAPACEAAHVPIIAITTNPRHRARCLEAGMDDLLPKPFFKHQLCESLRRWHGDPCNEAVQ